MNIPVRLASAIASDPQLQSYVSTAVAKSRTWLQEQMLFFPEYTDHSSLHCENILRTADALIPDRCHHPVGPMSARDAAALVLSTLLHDLGMHLTWEGFLFLVGSAEHPGELRPALPNLDRKAWPEIWEEYLAEARRWDERRRKETFGDAGAVVRPPEDELNATLRDRLVIGEFLRRNHARLSHEIAVAGFPSRAGRIAIFHEREEWLDLVGLIARSHGMAVRESLDVLRARFHLRVFQDVHAPYLIVLLRIADYMQVQRERAPNAQLEVRSLKSPTSKREWSAHGAIRNISFEEDDPEAMYVDAQPGEIATYLRIKDILLGLQSELDTSWAVLGEVYGRHPRLRDLHIALRRVRSNLDDESFASTVSYIPVRASFEAAGIELLKLLIRPLYSGDVHAGVRELIQNAVDACRERTDLAVRGFVSATEDGAPSVQVRLDGNVQEGWTLTVSDSGVGMAPATILNYFLRVGATFRSSETWQSEHVDETGVRIARAGRFGIGVLAAFILGPEIEVETRHVSGRYSGVSFQAKLENETIELRKISTVTGTRIRIRLYESVANELLSAIDNGRHQWGKFPGGLYVLQVPELHTSRNGVIVPGGYAWPPERGALGKGWRRLQAEGFRDVQWTFDLEVDTHEFWGEGRRNSGIACNGLAVTGHRDALPQWNWTENTLLAHPTISLFEGSPLVSLSLDRTQITDVLPFKDILWRDVARDIAAAILIAPELASASGAFMSAKLRYPPAPCWPNRPPHFAFRRDGYTVFPNDSFAEFVRVFHILVPPGTDWRPLLKLFKTDSTLLLVSSDDATDHSEFQVPKDADVYRVAGHGEFIENARFRLLSNLHSGMAMEWQEGIWECYIARKKVPSGHLMRDILKVWNASVSDSLTVIEYVLKVEKNSERSGYISAQVNEYLGGTWIPYDMDQRRRKFRAAFDELAPFIARHLDLQN